jgi:hypothetical protein
MRYRSTYEEDPVISCGYALLILAFNLWIGGWSVNYLPAFFLDKTIPALGAALIGLIVAQISVPVAIVVALLRAFGVL